MEESRIDLEDIIVVDCIKKQCGEIFISIDGTLSFLCTLCGIELQEYIAYYDHIIEQHYFVNEPDEDELLNENIECDFTCDNNILLAAEANNNTNNIEYEMELRPKILYFSEENNENSVTVDASVFIENSTEYEKNRKPQPTRRYSCPKCSFLTKTHSQMIMHIQRKHFSQKKKFCKICDRGFLTSNELLNHTRIHTNKRPFLCIQCGFKFKTYSTLWRHIKSCKNIRNIECPNCDMKFCDKTALRSHMAVHSEDRPFQCTLCEMSFKLKKTLRVHMKIHENKLEFQCDYCLASYNQQPSLLSHAKKKHPEQFQSAENNRTKFNNKSSI